LSKLIHIIVAVFNKIGVYEKDLDYFSEKLRT